MPQFASIKDYGNFDDIRRRVKMKRKTKEAGTRKDIFASEMITMTVKKWGNVAGSFPEW